MRNMRNKYEKFYRVKDYREKCWENSRKVLEFLFKKIEGILDNMRKM